MKEFFKSIALLSASLLLTIGASEFALRATGYRPTLADPDMYVANDDPYLPYRMRPGYEGYYMGRHVRLDADGYRMTGPVRKGNRTVLLVGDSVVFGHGLADEETPQAQLQEAFGEEGVTVRNVAVSGYTTWNEFAALEDYLATHEVDVVVVVHLENDITFDHNQMRISQGEFGNIGTGAFHRATQALYRHVYLSYLVKTGIERMKRASSPSETVFQRASMREEGAFAHSMDGLERIHALCRREGAALRVGIYRDLTYYDDPEGVRTYEGRVRSALEERGIDAFVIGRHVEELDLEAARLSWNDPHPTARAVGLFVNDIKTAAEAALAR